MHTIHLNVSDKVYDRFIWLLSKFDKNEVEILPDSTEFPDTKEYLNNELREITEGKAGFIEMDELEQRLETILKRNEDNL